jgi:hypothetical protein
VAAVPEDVVRSGLAAFEKAYNEDDMAFCGACYTKNCHVTVNGGTGQCPSLSCTFAARAYRGLFPGSSIFGIFRGHAVNWPARFFS